jgi:hypothetical protein
MDVEMTATAPEATRARERRTVRRALRKMGDGPQAREDALMNIASKLGISSWAARYLLMAETTLGVGIVTWHTGLTTLYLLGDQ